jgi:hypothetical protein
MSLNKNKIHQIRQSKTYLRRRRGFIIALTLTIAFIYCLPFLNLFAQHKAHSLAYENHITPQIAQAKRKIELNSRLLPRFKFENLSAKLNVTQPALLWVGNSTQFHIRQNYLEQGFRCKIKNFYNISYHSPDPDDLNRMLSSIANKLMPGSTVVMAIYPEMFTLFTRVSAPSLLHPWSTVNLWFKNIRDGNTSFSSLFPNFIKLEWPQAPYSNFPFVTYYRQLIALVNDGFADEYVFADGSVEFIGAEKQNRERNAKNELIYFDHHIFAQQGQSPIFEDSFHKFNELIERLTTNEIDVVAFEAVLHPTYDKLRKIQNQRIEFENRMGQIQKQNKRFHFYPREISNIEIPDQLWLDETHVSFEGGRRIAMHHGTYIKRTVIC